MHANTLTLSPSPSHPNTGDPDTCTRVCVYGRSRAISQELHLSDWLNPLICTMVAGFTIVNYTQAGKQFHEACDSLSGPIYLLFFLYTGHARKGSLTPD